MNNSRIHLAARLALLVLAMGLSGIGTAASRAPSKAARTPTKSPAAIAQIAGRHVDEADIRRAALVLAGDPLRTRGHAAWRKKLLDLCVDRELLAMEAERMGFLNDGAVKRRMELSSSDLLYDAIRERVLIPQVTPNATQIDTARAGGLFRRVKLEYVLSVTDKKATYQVLEAIRHGARFDSMAALYSIHPSAKQGGMLGWKYVGELNADSWREFKGAKPGDLMGPYFNNPAHEFYRVDSIVDPDDKEITQVMLRARGQEMQSRYQVRLLQESHFRMNPDGVSSILFAAATEPADSILASLDAGGHRPKTGIHPALGVLATVDGDSITYRDISAPDLLPRGEDGKGRIEDTRMLIRVTSLAVLPRLIAKDAAAHGIDREPAVARRLRLIREEESTRAMVARAVPVPDSVAVRAYFRSHASSFQRPAARRAFVAMFAAADSARAALLNWKRREARDSIFTVEGFQRQDRLTVATLFPRAYGELSLFDTDQDPLSLAVRGMAEGQIAPLIETPNGYAVAVALGREPARPYTVDEVWIRAATEAREDAENLWVVRQLERLRAATPARTVPARLDAVRLGWATETGGNRR